ncbi:MAG: hypothetical protein IPK70_11705 [Flavobacteriales bacterium]|nr:hypothetical protein [Flavobacteriales bacterium]
MNCRNTSTRATRFSRWCKAGLLGAAIALLGTQTNAQVTTNGGSGLALSYPDLATAITALNGVGTATSPTVITLDPANPQTAPAGGYTITATGDATNTITIAGSGNTITSSTALVVGSLHDAIFEIIGGDYITIENFTMLEDPANIVTTAGSNNMTEFGVAVFYATTTDGAQNITIQNNTIDLNRTYQNTFGIYATSQHTATVLGAAQATAPTGAHNNLRIYGNQITDVNTGICANGATTFANYAQGLDIGGTVGPVGNLGNTITNFGTTGTFSSYTGVSGTVNGIQITNQLNANVSWNSIFSSVGGVTVTSTLRGIYYRQSAAPTSGSWTSSINDNAIGLQHGAAGGAMFGIADETGSAFNTLNIINNDFLGTGWTVPGTGAYTAISNTVAEQNVTINANGFFSLSLNTTGNVSLISNNLSRPAGASSTCNDNAIVGGFAKTLGGGTVFCYDSFGISSNTGTETFINNNFSDGTVTGATTLRIVRVSDGSATAPTRTCTNNTISNWVGGTGTITCLTSSFGLAANTNLVANNTISNISGGGTVIGLESTAGTQIIRNNAVTGLSSTGASAVSGIVISGGTTQTVERNKVCNIEGSNASSTVNGIINSAGTTANIRNNTIGDLRAPIANAANPVVGINITGGTTANVDYNTVYLNALSTGALFGTSALSASTTPALTLRNNILVNNSTPTGAGLVVAYRRSTTTLTSYQAASDRNLFYAGVPGPQNLIFSDGTNLLQDFALNYQPFVTARDANSVTENPTFASTSCGASDFLHFAPATSTLAESAGANIAGITNDYDDNVRQGNPGYAGTGSGPDIGADEFEGLNPLACVGAPTAGTIGGTSPICAGTGTTLSLSGHSTGLGIIYQWRMGTTSGGPYGTTLGTASTQATGVMAAGTYYYVCDVTCTSPGGSTVQTAEFTLVVDPTPVASATSNSPVCEGQTLNLDGNGGIGTSYSWTGPGYGGGSNEDESILSATLANSGAFTFTSTLGSCTSAPVIVNVTVNPNPTGVTANATDLIVCAGDLVDLSSTGFASGSSTILAENFNGVAAGWTTVNNSTGGVPANAAWTLRPNGYVYSSTTYNSNDASQFYMTNSDAQTNTPVSATATELISPSFSLAGFSAASLSMWHYYRDIGDTGDSAVVEVSTNGGATWAIAQAFTTTLGTPAVMVNANVSLNAFAGQSNVIVRFRYRATWDWYWTLDNVTVSGTPLPTFSWVSSPAYFTSGVQNPTGVAVSPAPTTFTVTATNPITGCFTTANVTVNPDLTDTDGDLITDCDDSCPSLPGEIGDPCDDGDGQTALDYINGSCACAGQVCTTDLDFVYQADGVDDLTWVIYEQGTNLIAKSGGGALVGNGSEATCLPDGCFYIVVTDAGGDGIVNGGYLLKINSSVRLIDNLYGTFGEGGFTSGSTSRSLPTKASACPWAPTA